MAHPNSLAAHLPFTPVSTLRAPSAPGSPRTPRARLVAGPAVVPMRGQFTPSRFSSAPKAFSTFTYTGDPNYYERLERSRRPPSSKQASSAPSSPCGSNQPFKICGVPSGPRHTGTFAVFTYDVDPAERRQAARKQAEQQDSERVRAGAFVAGGRPKDNKQAMQGRLPELLKGVHKTLLADWLAFHSMSVDAKGYVLAIFAAESLSAQRRDDLHTYMNRFVGHHRLATLFGLTRDPKSHDHPPLEADLDADATDWLRDTFFVPDFDRFVGQLLAGAADGLKLGGLSASRPRNTIKAKITGAALAAAFASKDEAADAVEETLEEKEERVIEAIRDGLDAGIGKPRRAFTALGDFGKRSGSLAQTWLTPEQLENCAYFWAGGSTVLARDVSKWRLTARDVKASPWFILLALNTFPWTPLLAPLVARAVNGTGTGAFLPSAFSARRLAALKRLRGDAGLNPESVDPESPDRTPANIDEGVRFFRDGSKIALRDLLRGRLATRADDKLAAYGWFGFLAVSTFPLTPLLLPVIDKRREGSQSDYVPSAFRARRLAAFHRLNSARETDREADRETEKLLVSKKKLLDAKKKLTDGALDRK